jgi:thiamine kinase-like enzyme
MEQSKNIQNNSRNLVQLLNLPACQQILIVGNEIRHWQRIFPMSSFCKDLDSREQDFGPFDLILYHCHCSADTKKLFNHLSLLNRIVKQEGRLLLIAPNAYSIKNIKRLKQGLRPFINSELHCNRITIPKTLKAANFSQIQEFIAIPALENSQELVSAASPFLELPFYWHPLLHIAHRIKVFPFLADGYYYIAGQVPLEKSQLFKEISYVLSSKNEHSVDQYSIGRIDMRLRGSMILFVSEKLTGCNFIVRIVSNLYHQKIVRRNKEFIIGLEAFKDLPASIKTMIPQHIGEFRSEESIIYVETLLGGILAWKRNSGTRRKRIYNEATDFILRFQLGTQRKIKISHNELKKIFEMDLANLANCTIVSSNLKDKVIKTINKIQNLLFGREVVLVASHGDYGYGNILVDAKTGKMTGVIDWDTGRNCDLPGIDLLNMEVQRIKSENKIRLSDAFVKLVSYILKWGSLDNKNNYQKYFKINFNMIPIVLYLTLIRYMTRAAQYPEVFSLEQDDFLKTFNLFSKMLSL